MAKEKNEAEGFQKFEDITENAKAEIRAKHPGAIVYSCPVNQDEKDMVEDEWSETAKFIVVPADRAITNMVERYASEKNFPKFKQALIKNCVKGGDMEHLDEDRNIFVYKSVVAKAADLMGIAKGAVAKL